MHLTFFRVSAFQVYLSFTISDFGIEGEEYVNITLYRVSWTILLYFTFYLIWRTSSELNSILYSIYTVLLKWKKQLS